MEQIAHVDMDAFFVSVEELYDPTLRGKPVVVGAAGDERGVVAAASYEARKYGIHSAMPSRTAKRLCPEAIFLPGNYDRYQEWSDKVRKILERFTPIVQMVSIDEAYLDLTGTERLHGAAPAAGPAGSGAGGAGWTIAQKIQRAIWEETKLPCSIGVANSYLVAKVASDVAKPRGLLWVPAGAEAAFLSPLPVRRIPGIGAVTEKVLYAMGVGTVGELARVTEDQLVEAFGAWGKGLYLKARGQDTDLWFVDEEQKSISHERTFAEDVSDPKELDSTLAYLAELVGRRLREHCFHARTITLKLRTAEFRTLTRAKTLREPTDLDAVIYETAAALFRRAWDRKKKVRLVGIAAGSLTEGPQQLPLLEAERRARQEKLARAADKVRARFGTKAIRSAKTLPSKPR
ncbi:MAG: DNA polymerase IV [Acidobacteria bacterium]|nr:DNA polymerase IV [Acidobacteriota bacterium]